MGSGLERVATAATVRNALKRKAVAMLKAGNITGINLLEQSGTTLNKEQFNAVAGQFLGMNHLGAVRALIAHQGSKPDFDEDDVDFVYDVILQGSRRNPFQVVSSIQEVEALSGRAHQWTEIDAARVYEAAFSHLGSQGFVPEHELGRIKTLKQNIGLPIPHYLLQEQAAQRLKQFRAAVETQPTRAREYEGYLSGLEALVNITEKIPLTPELSAMLDSTTEFLARKGGILYYPLRRQVASFFTPEWAWCPPNIQNEYAKLLKGKEFQQIDNIARETGVKPVFEPELVDEMYRQSVTSGVDVGTIWRTRSLSKREPQWTPEQQALIIAYYRKEAERVVETGEDRNNLANSIRVAEKLIGVKIPDDIVAVSKLFSSVHPEAYKRAEQELQRRWPVVSFDATLVEAFYAHQAGRGFRLSDVIRTIVNVRETLGLEPVWNKEAKAALAHKWERWYDDFKYEQHQFMYTRPDILKRDIDTIASQIGARPQWPGKLLAPMLPRYLEGWNDNPFEALLPDSDFSFEEPEVAALVQAKYREWFDSNYFIRMATVAGKTGVAPVIPKEAVEARYQQAVARKDISDIATISTLFDRPISVQDLQALLTAPADMRVMQFVLRQEASAKLPEKVVNAYIAKIPVTS